MLEETDIGKTMTKWLPYWGVCRNSFWSATPIEGYLPSIKVHIRRICPTAHGRWAV